MYQIDLLNVEALIRKRIETGPILESNNIASIMKRRRLDLNLTLAQTTRGICSEALQSKLERNQADIRNKVVPLLCERLQLDYDELSKKGNNQRVDKALNYFMSMEYEELLSIEETVCDGVYVAEDEIIKAFKYLVQREFKKLNNCILTLDTVKECLSDIELFSLLLIVFEYNVYILKCNKALEYMELLEIFCLKQEKCKLFLKERKFILSCIMEHSDVKYLFEDIRRDFHLYPIEKQFGFSLYYYQTLNTEDSYNYLEEMGKKYIPEQYKEDYNYAKALLLSKIGRHLDAMKAIIESGYTRAKFICLFAYNLFLYSSCSPTESEYKSYKGKLLSLMKIGTRNSGDTYHVAFLKLMQLEIEKSSIEIICNDIKNCFVKELYDYCYPLYDEYITERYCLLLGKLCRYKDAYLFLLQSKIHLKK